MENTMLVLWDAQVRSLGYLRSRAVSMNPAARMLG